VDPASFKPVECSREEGRDRWGSFVVEQLDVGQAGMIINDCVSKVIAPARASLGAGSVSNSGHGVPWTLKARMARGVHGSRSPGHGHS
jgi:hypothetical protein